MQGFTGWLKGAVPDNEPSLVADWKSYANNQPNATAARSDGVLSSAEEGASNTFGGFWNSTFASFTSAANGAAGSMSSGMARYVACDGKRSLLGGIIGTEKRASTQPSQFLQHSRDDTMDLFCCFSRNWSSFPVAGLLRVLASHHPGTFQVCNHL
jgi:hypothetical protein